MGGRETSTVDRRGTDVHGRHRLSRYDLQLAVVPAAFLLGLLAAGLAGVPVRIAMSSAAAVGAMVLLDGLFINPPRRPGAGERPG